MTLDAGQPAALGDGFSARIRDGAGPGVLWIHGYTLDSSVWGELWSDLPGWRHVGLDLPGHGGSAPFRAGESLPELARRIGTVAARQGVEHVIGLSFGGMVALQVAIEQPSRFKTLSLCSPAVGGAPADPDTQTRNLELTRMYRDRGAGPWLTELWMRSPPDIFKGAAARGDLFSNLREIVDRHSWSELGDASMQEVVNHPRQLQQLHDVRAATLVIVGEHDMPAFKRVADQLRRRIRRCRRMYWPGTGHLSFLEDPSGVSRVLDAQLRV